MKIVCVHGFGGGASEFKSIVRHLSSKSRIRAAYFSYSEKFGTVSLRILAERLAKLIKKEKPDAIIGLSQGGIIGALALEEFGMRKICDKCVTVCTPFNGSMLAFCSNTIGAVELRPGSKLLLELGKRMKKSRVKYFSAWNPIDLMVFPGSSANCKNAVKSMKVYSLLHPLTWRSRKVQDFTVECLGAR